MTIPYICTVVLLLHSTTLTSAVLPEILPPEPVNGFAGEDLILPCYLKNNVSAVDMEIQWLINGNSLIHHYKGHKDLTDQQIPEYRNRTSLFRDELLKGNISLKLTQVRPSDTNTYTCLVRADGGSDDKSFAVNVNEYLLPFRHHFFYVKIAVFGLGGIVVAVLCWLYHKHKGSTQVDTGLQSYNQLASSEDLRSDSTFPCSISSSALQEYKDWIKTNLKNFCQGCQNGKYASLGSIYIELDIVKINQVWKDGDHFIPRHIEYPKISVDNFFTPRDGPIAVVLQGQSGHGKSFTAQKIIEDWANGVLFVNQFDLVLLLKCEELNQKETLPSTNWLNLFSFEEKFRPLIKSSLEQSPEKVLLIIDGLEQFFPLETVNNMHFPSESSLLITTRSATSENLKKLTNQRQQLFTEILGFSGEKVNEYFQEFFKDEQMQFERAFQCVQQNEMLFTFCHIPIICWIACTVLKDDADTMEGLQTTTSFFVYAVDSLLKNCDLDKSQLLLSLCQLAEKGRQNLKVLFNQTDVSDAVFPNLRNPFLWRFNMSKYGFFHHSFQEFFSALHFLLKKETQIIFAQLNDESFNTNVQLQSIIQFLFGLSNLKLSGSEKLIKMVTSADTSETQHNADCVQKRLKDWIMGKVKKVELSENPQITCFIIQCLFELHDEVFVKNVLEDMKSINLQGTTLTKRDCFLLQYCLQCSLHIQQLNLSHCRLTAEEFKMLESTFAFLNCDNLRLDIEGMENADVENFTTSLCKKKKNQIDVNKEVTNDRVKSVHLRCFLMKIISFTTANCILNSIQNSRMHLEISLMLDKQSVSRRETCCASFSVKKDDNCITLILAHDGYSDQATPALHQITLILPLANCNIDWTSFLQGFERMKGSATIAHQNDNDGKQKKESNPLSFLLSLCDVKKLELKLSCLTESLANGIFSLFDTFSGQQDTEEDLLKVCTNDDHERSLCSSLSFSKDDHNHRVTVSHKCIENQTGISLISVTMPRTCNTDWIAVLTKLRSLDIVNGTELDRHAGELFSLLSDLRELKLEVGCLTEKWANRIFSFVKNHCSEQKFKVCVSGKCDSNGDSLCSSLSFSRDDIQRVTVIRKCQMDQTGISLISVTMPRTYNTDWISVLKMFRSLDTVNETELDRHAGELFSRLSALRELKLEVGCLTVNWAGRIFSFVKNHCSAEVFNVRVMSQSDRHTGNLCSSLLVEKNTEGIRLTAEEKPFRDNSTPYLSHISVLSKSVSDKKWVDLLKLFQTVSQCTDRDQRVDGQVGALLNSLNCFDKLMRVELHIKCFNKMWAKRILSLIQSCESLQEIIVSSGLFATCGNQIGWIQQGPLKAVGIDFLKKGKPRENCTIILRGIKPSTLKGQSSERPIEFTIKGTSIHEKYL